MKAELAHYAVTCNCTGGAELIALINDQGPGGSISVFGPEADDSLIQMAVADGEDHARLYKQATASWADYKVTETEWADGHSTWTIRCHHCNTQTQFRDAKLAEFVNDIRANLGALPLIKVGPFNRHQIPLGVLDSYMRR